MSQSNPAPERLLQALEAEDLSPGLEQALLELAEEVLLEGGGSRETWRLWLERTARPAFLGGLGSEDLRRRWADVCFRAIRLSDYDLDQMLAQRVEEHGERTYLAEWRYGESVRWSYAQVRRKVRGYAAALLRAGGERPRVALYLANSLQGATADLACLLHDILVSPLAVHLESDELVYILDRLSIDVVVTDSEERARRLLAVRQRVRRPFHLFVTRPGKIEERGDAELLERVVAGLDPEEIDTLLEHRPRIALDEPCTVMFTSGSTGRPKGLVFTRYHLISKRFARAAALPEVGREESLLSYLPLFHTFGRFLELLGMLFWRGTYVFSGNPSAETLLEALPQVEPSGMIGIPLRWSQVAERCRQRIEARSPGESEEDAFRSVVGPRLRWGLSAAGYLAPRDFRFFQRHGVALCSGFGMTEATGGITMTPPGEYRDDSVGVPLPGMRIRFRDPGEMLIGGEYVAGYLQEEGEGLELVDPLVEEGQEWIATGDLFQELGDGHLTIVDRIKDIYKNSRGQTVAPRRVESRFFGVPGIQSTFLVGDHRAYNTLLVVPDREDPVWTEAADPESRTEYYRRMVAMANATLIPFERVVDFALLERNFSQEEGELTPKGSFRRKVIEANFAEVIEGLYVSREVELEVGGFRVRLPRWFYRDLGILDRDIVVEGEELLDRRRDLRLRIWPRGEGGRVRIGDLEYLLEGEHIDLGVLARQPMLWSGNPSLLAFAPCKAGWNVPTRSLSPHVLLPAEPPRQEPEATVAPKGVEDPELLRIDGLIQRMLFGSPEEALERLEEAGAALAAADYGIARLLRSRITALARHPDLAVRSCAYRKVLLDAPRADGEEEFFAFIESGLPFLDTDSIEELAAESLGAQRLEALRRRLLRQRHSFSWPSEGVSRRQFESLLELLVRFVELHPAYFGTIRQELAAWALHEADPGLAAVALDHLHQLDHAHQQEAREEALPPAEARSWVRFDPDIPDPIREELLGLLVDRGFLAVSVRHAFEVDFQLGDVVPGGIWVAGQRGWGRSRMFRVSVNTREESHFDLLVTLLGEIPEQVSEQTILWTLLISGYPEGRAPMPRLGCLSRKAGAVSLEFVEGLTVGEKIRHMAGLVREGSEEEERELWRHLFVRGMATFFRAWRASDERIVPGRISPRNVVVAEQDFHEGTLLLSLSGWCPYRSPSDLVRPLLDWFLTRTQARYPRLRSVLERRWIFQACLEGLGEARGRRFLEEYLGEGGPPESKEEEGLRSALRGFLGRLQEEAYDPLPLVAAISRYHHWLEDNPSASCSACNDQMEQLQGIYHLERFGETARFAFYARTYFQDRSEAVCAAFDRLLEGLRAGRGPASRMVELFDLQASLETPEDRETFGKLVFPRGRGAGVELLAFGESTHLQVTMCTDLVDSRGDHYQIREPVGAEETGTLYRLYFLENIPKRVQAEDRHLVVLDDSGAVVGGLTYNLASEGVVHMDFVVVKSGLTRRGIARGLVEDFASRLEALGVRVLKTGFLFPKFLGSCGFQADRSWGGLVRLLGPEEAA